MPRPKIHVLVIGLLLAGLVSVTPARAQELLRYKFKAGDKYRNELTQKMKVEVKVGENTVNTDMTQVIEMACEAKSVDKDGKAKLSQTFDRVRLTMDTPQGKTEYDSKDGKMPDGPIGALIGPVYKALVGAVFSITMDGRGQISDVEVPKELTEAMKNNPTMSGMGEMFTPDGMKRMLSQSGLILPEGPPTKGQASEIKLDFKMPFGKMMATNTVTYEGTITRDSVKLAQFAMQPKIKFEPDPNAAVNLSLKGQDAKGTALFDPAAGRLVETTVNQKMEMEVQTMGQTLKQNMEQTVTMKLLGKEQKKSP